jgi:RNA polymerase sigma-70 factor (ECF subfamily)
MGRRETTILLRRAKEGAHDALDAVYQRVSGKLLAFIRLRMGPTLRARLESRDILQATLLKSFEHFREFEQSDAASLMAWLARIAENEIRDQADRQGRQRRDARAEVPLESDTSFGAGHVAGALRSALSQLILDEQARQLEQALETLNEHHREVILLRHYEELSFREIGLRVGKSEDAARMLYARALAALTMRMTRDGTRT